MKAGATSRVNEHHCIVSRADEEGLHSLAGAIILHKGYACPELGDHSAPIPLSSDGKRMGSGL